MATPLRVLYVFTARKRGLLEQAARGEAPDTLLFGYNHLRATGVAPSLHEPDYPHLGRALARRAGRLGPDFLQLRTLRLFPNYDVVFLTGGWPLLLAARAIPRRRRPKLVWLNMTLTNLLRRPHPTTALLRLAIRRADRVVCVARHQQAFLQDLYHWPEARLPLALSGTDGAFFRPGRDSPGGATGASAPPGSGHEAVAPGGQRSPTVLAAGRDAGRDYATLLRALPRGAALRLVCSRRNLAGLDLPPQAGVRYDIPPAALRQEYAGADVVAVPTHGDASLAGSDCSGTLVLLDALAMGRPAVISGRASVGNYVTPGEHALTVSPGDPLALKGALDFLLTDREGAARLAAAGRERVLTSLTTPHFARRLAEIFHQVAGESGRPAGLAGAEA